MLLTVSDLRLDSCYSQVAMIFEFEAPVANIKNAGSTS